MICLMIRRITTEIVKREKVKCMKKREIFRQMIIKSTQIIK